MVGDGTSPSAAQRYRHLAQGELTWALGQRCDGQLWIALEESTAIRRRFTCSGLVSGVRDSSESMRVGYTLTRARAGSGGDLG